MSPPPQTAVCFNFSEYRSGLWLPKAYIIGLDANGEPHSVHQAANPTSLLNYGVVCDDQLEDALSMAYTLRDKTIAERFRDGSKAITLSSLIGNKSKDRARVVTYIHAKVSALLHLCRREGYFTTVNLDSRASPAPYLVKFATWEWQPTPSFRLEQGSITYRLHIQAPEVGRQTIRMADPRIITDRPAPAWILTGDGIAVVAGLSGRELRPFLARDEITVGPDELRSFLKSTLAPMVRRYEPLLVGMRMQKVNEPDMLEFTARLHPFDDRYYLYPVFRYGRLDFTLGEVATTKVTYNTQPPIAIEKACRDQTIEAALMAPIYDRGLAAVPGVDAIGLTGDTDRYANLSWMIENLEWLSGLGIKWKLPEEEGKTYVPYPGEINLSVEQTSDWLDLKGRVTVGDQQISFAKLITYLRRGERRFPLPDGNYFLLPESWLTTYGVELELASIRGEKVRLARSQVPLLQRMGIKIEDLKGVKRPLTDYHPGPDLKAKLRPYQLEGVRWLVDHHHRQLGACLADDMGLGKTLQTIAVLLYAKNLITDTDYSGGRQIMLFGGPAEDEVYLRPLRALLVLPASLIYNWTSELLRFAPSLSVHVNLGSKRERDPRILSRYDILITTYQTALRDVGFLDEIGLSYIILDESQQIKNRNGKVFRALNGLAAPHRISLSGTPIENSLADLWSQMQFINPGLLGTFALFRKQFIVPIEEHDHEGKKERLRQLVSPYLMRRTKKEVAPDLPELDVQLFFCEMTSPQRKLYEQERSAARNALLGIGEPTGRDNKLLVIQALTRLRQLANHPAIANADYDRDSGKFNEVIEQWDSLRRGGHKVLIFSSMVRQLTLFRKHLDTMAQPYAWLTGSVSAQERAREVARFQEDPTVQTFLISIKAGGAGLNLTAADYVFILDPWWNPSTEEQAIARAHRIGRDGKVFARKFLTIGTLEVKIHRLQQKKKRLAVEIIDRSGGIDFDEAEIAFLLE